MIELGIGLALGFAMIKGIQSIYQRKNALGTDEFVTAWASRAFWFTCTYNCDLLSGNPEFNCRISGLCAPPRPSYRSDLYYNSKSLQRIGCLDSHPDVCTITYFSGWNVFFYSGRNSNFQRFFLGIILITFGTYILKIDGSKNLFEPLRKLWNERGVQLILAVILIYSVTANIDKLGVKMSSAVMWPLAIYFLSSMF